MKCQRCGGIMVSEPFYSLEDVFQGYRCIFCGEIIDPVILRNRWSQNSNRSDGSFEGGLLECFCEWIQPMKEWP